VASVFSVLEEVTKNIHANRDFLRTVDRSHIVSTVFAMLLAGVVCLKHEGFHEEREWRAIYAPNRGKSRLMESSTEVIEGVPQLVHKIPLDANKSEYLVDLDFPKIFDRPIIGPTSYPWPMYEAFVDALAKAGVVNASERLVSSGIPIRT
jgi:hypothetical protein